MRRSGFTTMFASVLMSAVAFFAAPSFASAEIAVALHTAQLDDSYLTVAAALDEMRHAAASSHATVDGSADTIAASSASLSADHYAESIPAESAANARIQRAHAGPVAEVGGWPSTVTGSADGFSLLAFHVPGLSDAALLRTAFKRLSHNSHARVAVEAGGWPCSTG